METKELKIQIPEGYEVDKDKSTFEKIVFNLFSSQISSLHHPASTFLSSHQYRRLTPSVS